MSSKKTNTNLQSFLWKIFFMHYWNVVGAFFNPKSMEKKLKVTIVTYEISIWYVFLPHLNLMITKSKVNLWEELGSMDLIHELINPWYGIYILHFILIQSSKINAHPQSFIIFLYHNNWRITWDGTRPYETQLQDFFNGILNIIWILLGCL